MDWGRAKNVLIYAFLLLNLVLSYQLFSDLQEQADSNLDITSLTEKTQKVMDEKGIKIAGQIPTEAPELPKITYRFQHNDNMNKRVIDLSSQVGSKLIFSPKELTNALQKDIPMIESYRYDRVLDREGVFVLHPLVEQEWPLFNVILELNYNNQQIVSYRLESVEISTVEDEKRQRVLSAPKALGNLIENFLPDGSVVNNIELGYYGQVFNSDAQLAAPAWRFTLENGEVYYVQGISGDVISPSTDDKIKE